MPVQICKNERKIRVLTSYAKAIAKTIFLLLSLKIAEGCGYGIYHRVKKGETLEDIARIYGVPKEAIVEKNMKAPYGFNPNPKEGDWVYIPLDIKINKNNKHTSNTTQTKKTEETDRTGENQNKKEKEEEKNQEEKIESENTTAEMKEDNVAGTGKDRKIDKTKDRKIGKTEGLNLKPEKFTGAKLNGSGFIWPVRGKIISGFGMRNGRHHKGIDIQATEGTDVLSVEDGVVIFSGFLKAYGNVVIIKHEGNYFTVYAHMKYNKVKEGEFVKKGEIIGEVGKTGNATTPHLHFEIRKGTKPLNPFEYLR